MSAHTDPTKSLLKNGAFLTSVPRLSHKNRVRGLKISGALLKIVGSVPKKFRLIPTRIGLGLC